MKTPGRPQWPPTRLARLGWQRGYTDVISQDTFGQKNTEYRESIYVGYRYYDKAEKTVRFPLDGRSFAIWDGDWKIPGGTYEIRVGASSRDIRLHGSLDVAGEAVPAPDWQTGSWYETVKGIPSREGWEKVMGHTVTITPETKKGQFTKDSTCMEMKDSSFVIKIQYKVTEGIIAKSFGGKKDYSDPAFKMMMVCATDCPLRAAIISSGGAMSDSVARGLVQMANGHMIRGIRAMLKK